jgi:2-methylaconitate cis-trans-isomerase PrpF
VFLHARDIPETRAARDAVLLALLGSPDPLQFDGLGGTYSSTSKAVIVEERGGTVHYRFAQVGVDEAIVDYSVNCGNLKTAVAPFAVDERLVAPGDGLRHVRLHNANTGVAIKAELEIQDGRARVVGDHAIPGVPGSGVPILTRYWILPPRRAGRGCGKRGPPREKSRSLTICPVDPGSYWVAQRDASQRPFPSPMDVIPVMAEPADFAPRLPFRATKGAAKR